MSSESRAERTTMRSCTRWRGGAIHVLGELKIHGKLTIICEDRATVLLPDKVTCDSLELISEVSSNVNSNDLEVASECKARASRATTASLYLKLGCVLTGSVTQSSTMNTWINWPYGRKGTDVQVDSGSVFSERDWNG